MAGHAGDVIATKAQVETARRGILTQLGDTSIADGFDSLADALDKLNMWGFVENEARVVAQLHAFSVRDNAIIHELTFAGACVNLEAGNNE